jgi:hypothetical protein
MASTSLIKLRVNTAEQVKESVSEPANTRMYLTYGRVGSWANDSAPPQANNSVLTEYEVWQQMIGGKKVLGSDICHVIPRFTWTANTVYTAYDHTAPNLYDGNTKFYVMTSNFDVYKCLANNSSANSTVEPVAINTTVPTELSDGYIWKYMYTVSDSDQLRFTNSTYMPVRYISADDGSLQWSVQNGAVDGSILALQITSGGSNYSNTSNLVVTISGDGTSATARANINTISKTVNSIQLTDYGSGYTFATVAIGGGGGTGATARAIIAPPGGHGKNALYELGGSNLMFNLKLKNSEDGILAAANDFRQIALIKDPLSTGGINAFSNVAFSQAYKLTTQGSGDYTQDEFVYQGASLTTSSFSGQILSWDSTNAVATIINTTGTPTSRSLVGANSFTSRFVSTITTRELSPRSGQVMYVDNFIPITRSSDQTEDFKIVLKF